MKILITTERYKENAYFKYSIFFLPADCMH